MATDRNLDGSERSGPVEAAALPVERRVGPSLSFPRPHRGRLDDPNRTPASPRCPPASGGPGLTGTARTSDPVRPPSDTPIPDRLWDGLVAWLAGLLAVCAAAIVISNTLGWPRRPPALLTGGQLAVLAAQALACSAFVVRSGRRLTRRWPGALAVAFTAAVPAGTALLMGLVWLRAGDRGPSWLDLLGRSIMLAAVEAAPLSYLLWLLGPSLRRADSGETDPPAEPGPRPAPHP